MNDVIKTIQNLKSIRDFSDKDISQEDWQTIMECSVRAANASARQSYAVVVVDDKQVMKELTGYRGKKMAVYCIDFHRIKRTAEYLNQSFDNPHMHDLITGIIDTGLVLQTAVITAKSMGIDTLITNGIFRGNLRKAYTMLELPEDFCFPLMSVIFGYDKQNQGKLKGRLSNDTIIHYGKYNKITDEKIKMNMELYNNRKNHMGLIDNWEELGFKNYMDWFFVKWMGGFKDPEKKAEIKKEISPSIKIFYEILEKVGFLDRDYY